MRVFVTGGTGAIGTHAVPALVAAGHSVTALARADAKAEVLRSQGAVPVSVSLFDRRGLADAFAGHDAVVNLAPALPSTTAFIRKSAWTECERVRAEGSAAVGAVARDAGVQQMIQVTSCEQQTFSRRVRLASALSERRRGIPVDGATDLG